MDMAEKSQLAKITNFSDMKLSKCEDNKYNA